MHVCVFVYLYLYASAPRGLTYATSTPPTAPPGTLHLLTRPRNERVQRQEVDRINRENKVRCCPWLWDGTYIAIDRIWYMGHASSSYSD